MKKTLTALVTAAICMGGLASLQLPRLRSQLTDIESNPELAQEAESSQRDRLQLWQTMPTLGFDNLVADWAFLGFLQYFGNSEARQITGYTVSPEFFEVIVTHDPYFRLPYRFLSSSVTLFAAQPDATTRLLEQGLSHMTPTFPEDSFWLWRYKAVDELLFLGDTEAAINSFEKSAEWAAQSPVEDADSYVNSAERTANFLRQDPDSRQVQANSWMMVWANAINENVRQFAQGQIEALGYQVTREGSSLQLQDTVSAPADESPAPSQEAAADPAASPQPTQQEATDSAQPSADESAVPETEATPQSPETGSSPEEEDSDSAPTSENAPTEATP
ncbi:MAG: hypothetical protein AAFQ89_07455 [Cyanobacteria bacterium J06626_18]